MSETNDQDTGKGRLPLRPGGRLELGRTVDAGSVRQTFSHGRSKVVQVEVRKKRTGAPGAPGSGGGASAPSATPGNVAINARGAGSASPSSRTTPATRGAGRQLTA